MTGKNISAVIYIFRKNEKIRFDDLPREEKIELASKWNKTFMEAAGYKPCGKGQVENHAQSRAVHKGIDR